VKVKDIMTTDVVVVDKDVNLRTVLKLMDKHDITKIPSLDNKKLVGVITDNIIAYKLGSIRKREISTSRLHASSVTDKEVDVVSPDTDVEKVLQKVGEPGPTMLCVVDKEKLVGVVTKADLLPLVKSTKLLKEVMQKQVYTVAPDDRVVHARRIMVDENVARLPVVDQGDLVGIVSDTEIAFALAKLKKSFSLGRQKHRLDELLVGEIMKQPVVWTVPSMKVSEAAQIMMKKNIGALPLLENNTLVGIVTRTDVLKTLPV
jgi:CBS domain-containing protein